MRRALFLVLALAACHHHRDSNAPGISDIEVPPADRTVARIDPEDPGENMLAVNPGLLAAGGARKDSPHALGEFGPEISVVRGSTPRSHSEDGFFIYPLVGVGAALGWSALRVNGGDADLGPLYAEVYRVEDGFAAGGGWSWNPADGDHGPQLFGTIMGFYVRARYLFDDGGELTAGLQIKVPTVWVWSR